MNTGDTISRYRIVRPLGRGGMGIVYQAEDTRLDRQVALKFLPAESMDQRDRERFFNEARAAARIRHPNVCPIYDVEESAGKIFLVMAYLEGETLAQRLARGPILVREAVAIGIQVARGLQQAHDSGIVHRDVKSSNILIGTGGEVSILDFGVALLPDATRLTASGSITGTPAYMSPEQTLAENIDRRTDIWSMGVVLFECLTGSVPFRGNQMVAVAHSVVYDPAPTVGSLRPDVPAALENAIAKALAKSPADRWQTARDFAAELENVQHTGSSATLPPTLEMPQPTVVSSRRKLFLAAFCLAFVALAAAGSWYVAGRRTTRAETPVSRAASGPKQIAVLPFQSSDPGKTRSIADGLQDVITDGLSDFQVSQGKVMPVPSSEIRRREIASPAEARRIYGVDLALTGSAEAAGNRIRFRLQLMDAANAREIGASQFEYDPGSPREAGNRAVEEVARMLDLKPAPAARMQTATTAQGEEAYSAYLEGRGLLSRYDVRGNLDKAVASLKRAVDLDPDFALAWAGLGEAYWRQARSNSDKRTAELALECAERAVRIDAGLVVVHTILGAIYGTAGRHDDAIREFETALKLAPANAEPPRELARIYTSLGRFQEAEASYLQAVKARPTDWYGHLLLGIFYNDQERYNEAETAFRRALELTPDNDIVARNLGSLYMLQGRYPEAVQVLLQSLKVRQNARTYGTLAATYFYQHRFESAAAAMETAVDLDSSTYIYWGNLGIYYKWIPGSEARVKPALQRAIELAGKRLEITPADHEIRADLAEYRARLGDSRGALAEIERIPQSARQPLTSRLAIAYELTGNRTKAIELIGSTLKNAASLTQVKDDPDLAKLWADPLFQETIRKSLRR